jgi:hypothetical protein
MRAALVALAACGAAPPPAEEPPPSMGRAISIVWRAAQADGDLVAVTIVVDRKPIDLGVLPAATDMEAGTPNTCALRAAHPLRTEFVCGDLSAFFAAELEQGELVISYVEGHEWKEMRRIPVFGEGLAVAPYELPLDPVVPPPAEGSATSVP